MDNNLKNKIEMLNFFITINLDNIQKDINDILNLTEDKKANIKSLEEYLKNVNKINDLYEENNNKGCKEINNINNEKYENIDNKRHEEKTQLYKKK